jgi:hypothetical protein
MIIKNKNFLLKSRNVQEIKTGGLLNANLKPGPLESHILKNFFLKENWESAAVILHESR